MLLIFLCQHWEYSSDPVSHAAGFWGMVLHVESEQGTWPAGCADSRPECAPNGCSQSAGQNGWDPTITSPALRSLRPGVQPCFPSLLAAVLIFTCLMVFIGFVVKFFWLLGFQLTVNELGSSLLTLCRNPDGILPDPISVKWLSGLHDRHS